MATYNYKTWESITLPIVSNDTYYRVMLSPSQNPGDSTSFLWEGLVKSGGRLTDLQEILTQYVRPTPLTFDVDPSYPVEEDTEVKSTFYIYGTSDDWDTWTTDIINLEYNANYDNHTSFVRSAPINYRLDWRQYFVYSVITQSGNLIFEPCATNTPNYNDATINLQLTSVQGDEPAMWTLMLYLPDVAEDISRSFPAGTPVYISRILDKPLLRPFILLRDNCYKWCLHYCNAYGGWDSLLIEGRELQTDTYNRQSYGQRYRAGSTQFNKIDYLNVIQRKWSLTTGWMNDDESSRMHHLLETNLCFLQDLETGDVIPVNISSSSMEHKTSKNQRYLYNYKIEVTASQPRYRT